MPAATTSTQSVPITMRRRESEEEKKRFHFVLFFSALVHMSTASKQDAIKIKLEKNTLNRLNGKK